MSGSINLNKHTPELHGTKAMMEEKVGLIYTDQGDSPEEVAAVDGGWGTQGWMLHHPTHV